MRGHVFNEIGEWLSLSVVFRLFRLGAMPLFSCRTRTYLKTYLGRGICLAVVSGLTKHQYDGNYLGTYTVGIFSLGYHS